MNSPIKSKEEDNTVPNAEKPKKIFVILAKPPDRTKAIQSNNVSSSPSIHSLRPPNKIQKTSTTSGKTGIPITVYIAPSTSKSNDSGTNSLQIIHDMRHNPTITQSNESLEMEVDHFHNTRSVRKDGKVSQITSDLNTGATSNAKKLVKWNRNACLLLAETYKIYENEFKATHTRKKMVWEKISQILNEKHGLGVNPTQCENKMRSILYSHQRVSDSKKLTETKIVNNFPLHVFEELRTEKDFIDEPLPNVIPKCVSLDAPGNKTPCNTFPEIAEISPAYRNVKLTKRDKMRRDKAVRLLINSVTEGMERRHKEKMTKCDRMIEILGKIVDKF